MLTFEEKNIWACPERKRFVSKACFGFKGNSVDPCLWTKYSNHGIVLFGIYVEDCLVIGSDEGINEVINGLTMLDLELVMDQHYRIEENEVHLSGFNGACFNCSK